MIRNIYILLLLALSYTVGYSQGNIECWGQDAYGQSSPPEGIFIDVALGAYHTCALDESGDIECWGQDAYGQSSPPEGTFTYIGEGDYNTCAIGFDEITGCTNPDACNYNADATVDDGSCTYAQDNFTCDGIFKPTSRSVLDTAVAYCYGWNSQYYEDECASYGVINDTSQEFITP
jgi:hypothetical protein